MTEILHCLYCGTKLASGAASCAACRMPVANVHIAPIADGVRCPRCKVRNAAGVLTRRRISEDCSTLECATCTGSFIEPHEWSAMVEELLANDPRVQGVGAAPKGELPLGELLGFLQCPGCNKELDRLEFAGRSNISIDVCTLHGAWFDAGELAKVLEIVRYKNDHAGAMPSDNETLTAEERREKVLQSMGISDPEFDKHRGPALKAKDGFNANRLAGRVAFVAGGLEGVAAYGVLKAVVHGSGAAFGWAVKGAAGDAPIGDVPRNIPSSRFGHELPALRCLFCGASHPESATECGQCRTPIARITCPACRSLVAAGEEKCRCGAPLLPDASREQMACPRCKSALERVALDENTVAHRCPRCLGSFFDIHDWTVVIDGAVSGRPLPLENFAPLPDRAAPAPFMDAGAACSRCRRAMERIAFAGRSRVVVDVCSSHGMWLDAGELNALCTFMNPTTRQAQR